MPGLPHDAPLRGVAIFVAPPTAKMRQLRTAGYCCLSCYTQDRAEAFPHKEMRQF